MRCSSLPQIAPHARATPRTSPCSPTNSRARRELRKGTRRSRNELAFSNTAFQRQMKRSLQRPSSQRLLQLALGSTLGGTLAAASPASSSNLECGGLAAAFSRAHCNTLSGLPFAPVVGRALARPPPPHVCSSRFPEAGAPPFATSSPPPPSEVENAFNSAASSSAPCRPQLPGRTPAKTLQKPKDFS
jgi:hypothetical protein